MYRKSIAPILLISVALCLLPASASAESVYVSDGGRLGSVDLATGSFRQIGPDFPDVSQGLGYAPSGSLLTMGFTGNLNSINPSTGVMTTIGPSGLGDCATPTSPCPPNSVNTLASFNGQTYATDFLNRLYRVNTSTGAATLIGTTGMPALPSIPLSENPDGTVNIYDEAFFAANGKLYATFDAGRVDFSTGDSTPEISAALYQIDPTTAIATLVGPTDFGIASAAQVSGITYAFVVSTRELVSLNLLTGGTTPLRPYDEAAGFVTGAVATPEPGTTGIAGLGLVLLAATAIARRRARPDAKA